MIHAKVSCSKFCINIEHTDSKLNYWQKHMPNSGPISKFGLDIRTTANLKAERMISEATMDTKDKL